VRARPSGDLRRSAGFHDRDVRPASSRLTSVVRSGPSSQSRKRRLLLVLVPATPRIARLQPYWVPGARHRVVTRRRDRGSRARSPRRCGLHSAAPRGPAFRPAASAFHRRNSRVNELAVRSRRGPRPRSPRAGWSKQVVLHLRASPSPPDPGRGRLRAPGGFAGSALVRAAVRSRTARARRAQSGRDRGAHPNRCSRAPAPSWLAISARVSTSASDLDQRIPRINLKAASLRAERCVSHSCILPHIAPLALRRATRTHV